MGSGVRRPVTETSRAFGARRRNVTRRSAETSGERMAAPRPPPRPAAWAAAADDGACGACAASEGAKRVSVTNPARIFKSRKDSPRFGEYSNPTGGADQPGSLEVFGFRRLELRCGVLGQR